VLAADMMRGRLRDDPDLAQAANAALGKNTDAMGKLVAGAFGSQAAAQFTPLWSTHVTALFNYARGLADGDAAVQAQAKVAVTRVETATLLPPGAAAVLGTPTWRLRSALTQLLGEHVELVVGALRAGVTDADDFTAAAAAVNANTADLAGAIDTLFERELAGFLTTATGDKLASATLAKALQSHDTMLRQQVDAFVAKDYATAHDVAYTTYQEMYGLAGQLADAFGSKVAARLPVGAAETGRGGTASGTGGR
jgi:hypothetical protein